MEKVINNQHLKDKILNKYKDEFSIIGECNDDSTEITLKHKGCGKTFQTNPYVFLEKGVCPYCYEQRYNKEKTDAMFRIEVKEKYGDEYEILTPYINSRTKITVRHKCGKEKTILPYPFLNNYHCPCTPKQKSKKLKRTTEDFKKEVYALVGDEYDVLGEYKGANVKTLMRHNVCGRTFEIEPVRFLNSHVRCIPCNRNFAKTTEDFKKDLKKLVGDDFSLVGDYVNAKTKIRIRCNHCGYEHDYLPRNFAMIKKCRNCKFEKKAIKYKPKTK